MNKEILISGCSFSQSQLDKECGWIPYSDLMINDFNEYTINNLAIESRGNGYIVDSIVNHIEHSLIKPSFIILQLSAFTRFMHHDMSNTFKSGQVYNDLFEYIYTSDYADVTHVQRLDNQIYLTNFVKIKMVCEYLKNTNIPHLIFFGWSQLKDSIKWQKSFKQIINNNTNFWSYNDFDGMLEFGIDNYGKKAMISKSDIHPTSIVHQLFYDKVVKPKILNEI
jgi:hypothetical protein